MPASTHNRSGFSLIEILVYISLLSILGTVLTLFATRAIERNARAQTTAQVLDNARGAMATIGEEIRQANGIYTPTSTFGASPGQLSLATLQNLPADENETYVDFYIDDERLYRKRESSAAELITAEQVKVTSLTFTHLNAASTSPAVRIVMTFVPARAAVEAANEATITLTTTTSLRSY